MRRRTYWRVKIERKNGAYLERICRTRAQVQKIARAEMQDGAESVLAFHEKRGTTRGHSWFADRPGQIVTCCVGKKKAGAAQIARDDWGVWA